MALSLVHGSLVGLAMNYSLKTETCFRNSNKKDTHPPGGWVVGTRLGFSP